LWLGVGLAEPPTTPEPRTPSTLAFGIGVSYWPDVHDLDPAQSPFADQLGLFHTWGFELELGYHRRVARTAGTDLMLGVDFGVLSHENSRDLDAILFPSGVVIDGTLAANVLFLTPSVRWVVAGSSKWRFFVGGGVGYYDVEFSQFLEDSFESDELFDESALGGYACAGFDRRLSAKSARWRLRIENKVHFVDFGSTDSYAPGAGELEGPISTILFAGVWNR
jgi:hypothetical protein